MLSREEHQSLKIDKSPQSSGLFDFPSLDPGFQTRSLVRMKAGKYMHAFVLLDMFHYSIEQLIIEKSL